MFPNLLAFSGDTQQIVGPERSKLVFRSQDLNAWFVDRRRVNFYEAG